MSKKNKQTFINPKDTGHKLKTRRDFISHGLLTGSSTLLAPSLFSMFKNHQVFGNVCPGIDMSNRIPVIILDCPGGAHLVGGNVLAGGPGGQNDFLSNYDKLGLPAELNPGSSQRNLINNNFNLLFHSESSILKGMLDTTDNSIRSKIDGGVFLGFTENDTQNNPQSPLYWFAKAGSKGNIFDIAGQPNLSGGRSNIPTSSYDPMLAKATIKSSTDLTKMVSFGSLNQQDGSGFKLNDSQVDKVLRTISRLSERKLASLSSLELDQQRKLIFKNSFDSHRLQCKSNLNPNFQGIIDPKSNQFINSLFYQYSHSPPFSGTNIDYNANVYKTTWDQMGTLAHAVLSGFGGCGTVTMSNGYDYHGISRSQAEGADYYLGLSIGKLFTAASAYGSDLLIYVITDGSVTGAKSIDDQVGKFNWAGDDSRKAASLMLYYKHSGGAVQMNSFQGRVNRQIGHFEENQFVDTNAHLAGNNVVNLAKLAVLNFLSLQGKEGELEAVVGDNPFASDLSRYLIFRQNT